MFLDINKQLEDSKLNLKLLEQDIRNKLLEKKKEIILDAAKLVAEQKTILRTLLERNLKLELKKSEIGAVKDVIQLLHKKDCLPLLKIKAKYLNPIYFLETSTCWKNMEQK